MLEIKKTVYQPHIIDSHKIVVTDITNKKEVVSFDIGKETFPVDLAVLPGAHGRKGCSVCISSSDGKIAIFTYSGLASVTPFFCTEGREFCIKFVALNYFVQATSFISF